MTTEAIHVDRFPWFDYRRYSYSLGLKTSAGTFLSGATASEFDAESKRMVVRGDMDAQASTIYEKVATILDGAALSRGDVARIVQYLRPEGIEQHAQAASVRERWLGGHQPVINTVPVKSLVRPDALIEVEATAGSSRGVPPGAVFLPTLLPVDAQGKLIGAGDLKAQLEAVYAQAKLLLAAQGLGPEHVVKVATYVAPSAARAYADHVIQLRHDSFGVVKPTVVNMVMPRLLHPSALVQCDFIATRERPVTVNPGWRRFDAVGCSPAVLAGKLLYMSGHAALDHATGAVLHEGDIVAQAETIYADVFALVRAAGGTPANLVKTIEYVVTASLDRYRDVGTVRSKLLKAPLPASTGLIAEAMLHRGTRIEVDALAVLD